MHGDLIEILLVVLVGSDINTEVICLIYDVTKMYSRFILFV